MSLRNLWTPAEVKLLRQNKHEPVSKIAKLFKSPKRTAGAIRQKASSIGVSLGTGKKKAA